VLGRRDGARGAVPAGLRINCAFRHPPTLKRGANKLCAYGADSAVAELCCRLLLSEDMQDGFIWKGGPVVNPFGKVGHSLLAVGHT
jgi:hypothetical protein